MNDDGQFAKRLVYGTTFGVFLLVVGVLFGPWEIDPQAPILIALVAQPGGVALGWLLPRGKE